MTTDLWMLVWTAILALAMPFTYATGRILAPGGSEWAFGNRETELAVPQWAARAYRAHVNLTENLAPFVILVLVAHVSGRANGTTALGATFFFWARLLYVPVYMAGLIYVRTAVFFVGTVGEIMILTQLF
jgi:uncharacterized MAPEG superfamily protein